MEVEDAAELLAGAVRLLVVEELQLDKAFDVRLSQLGLLTIVEAIDDIRGRLSVVVDLSAPRIHWAWDDVLVDLVLGELEVFSRLATHLVGHLA